MGKRIVFLTTFYESSSGYSLIGVCETQIRMLIDNGYDPAILVQENFQFQETGLWRREMIDIRPAIPFMHLTKGVAEDFEERVVAIENALDENLQDVDVCITHDIVFQPIYKEHKTAVYNHAQRNPGLLWLHYVHSRPLGSYNLPCGYVIYPNASERKLVAKNFGVDQDRVIPNRASHSIDPLLVWNYDKLTKDLVRKADLMSGDVVAIYPVRLDRAKQPERIIKIMAGVQEMGYEPRLLIVDWQSMGERFQKYMDELLNLTEQSGLLGKINFSSRLTDVANNGVPRHVVTELMDLSNVYIHPSSAETYSLVVHEAMLRGNLVVLNDDFPPMRELFSGNAIYMPFGSNSKSGGVLAEELMEELVSNKALWAQTQARRKLSPRAQWETFAELLELPPI